jgi:hypothetical protein
MANPTSLDEFFDAISTRNNLEAVLYGHLFIEGMLEKLILTSCSGSEPLFSEISYAGKINVAAKLNLVPKDAVNSLRAIGRLRNDFAHNLNVTAFSESQVRDMERSMSRDVKRRHEAFFKRDNGAPYSERPLPTRVFSIMANIWTDLAKAHIRIIVMKLSEK